MQNNEELNVNIIMQEIRNNIKERKIANKIPLKIDKKDLNRSNQLILEKRGLLSIIKSIIKKIVKFCLKIPVLGYILKIFINIVRLPRIIGDIYAYINSNNNTIKYLENRIEKLENIIRDSENK